MEAMMEGARASRQLSRSASARQGWRASRGACVGRDLKASGPVSSRARRERGRFLSRSLGFSSGEVGGGAGPGPGSKGAGESERVKQLNRASELLQTIIDEVSREHFIETAALIVEEDENDDDAQVQSLAQVARNVCKVYMDQLDNVFLASLLAYIQAAKEQDREDVVSLLNCIYEQIILLLRMDLPSGIQLVDILTQVIDKQDRERVMNQALNKKLGGASANASAKAGDGGDGINQGKFLR